MKQQTIGTKIKKELAVVLKCQVYGKLNQTVKAKTLFTYKGFTFFTAKDGKHWMAYEFKSGFLTETFGDSEKSVIDGTKRKIDCYTPTNAALYKLVKEYVDKEGFADHARYSNILPREIHSIN